MSELHFFMPHGSARNQKNRRLGDRFSIDTTRQWTTSVTNQTVPQRKSDIVIKDGRSGLNAMLKRLQVESEDGQDMMMQVICELILQRRRAKREITALTERLAAGK